jgi:thiol-disulfide isomerase/thioredoxin
MKLITAYVMTATLLLSLQSIAQNNISGSYSQQLKPLQIGDTLLMEKITFNNVRNYPGGKANLSDFKGKSIIIDFWNKTCSSCIAGFPHLEKIQKQFSEDLQVLLVTHNQAGELEQLFKQSTIVKNTKLPIVMGEKILFKELFPHFREPYQIWIDKSGIIKAKTTGLSASIENIQDLIGGKELKNVKQINPRMDVSFRGQALLRDILSNYSNSLCYYRVIPPTENSNSKDNGYVLIAKHNDDLQISAWSTLFDPLIKSKIVGNNGGNWSALDLYKSAYFSEDLTKIIVDNRASVFDLESDEKDKSYQWKNADRFIYEIVMPDYTSEKFRIQLKKALSDYFGFVGHMEQRELKHLILYRTAKLDNLKTKGGVEYFENTQGPTGFIFNNCDFGAFASSFINKNSHELNDPIVVDETGIDRLKKIDMIVTSKFRDIPSLRKEIAKYGLGIKEEIRTAKVLVLKNDKK